MVGYSRQTVDEITELLLDARLWVSEEKAGCLVTESLGQNTDDNELKVDNMTFRKANEFK